MTIGVKKWGHFETRKIVEDDGIKEVEEVVAEDHYIIEVDRQKLKLHLEKLSIPYDPKVVSHFDGFWRIVGTAAGLEGDDYAGYTSRSMRPEMACLEVRETGLKKLEKLLKKNFRINLLVTDEVYTH